MERGSNIFKNLRLEVYVGQFVDYGIGAYLHIWKCASRKVGKFSSPYRVVNRIGDVGLIDQTLIFDVEGTTDWRPFKQLYRHEVIWYSTVVIITDESIQYSNLFDYVLLRVIYDR